MVEPKSKNSANPAVVIDNGSSLCKAGLASAEIPTVVFPTIVGHSKSPLFTVGVGEETRDTFIGEEAKFRRHILRLKYPIEHGVITNWEDMEKIWRHCYLNELGVSPKAHPCLLTEHPVNPKANRERTTEIMFETFNVPSFYVGNRAVLSLYAVGKLTGFSVVVGDSVFHGVPVYEGYSLRHTISRCDLAGRYITDFFCLLINHECDVALYSSNEREMLKGIKEKFCFVALDYDKARKEAEQSSIHNAVYELPDGTTFTMGSQRFRAPEVLFQPNLVGLSCYGIHELILATLMRCDTDLRKELYQNICLSGGTAMIPGLPERLHKELTNLAPATVKIKVDAAAEGKYSAWIGGSIFASLSSFQCMLIGRDEYEEYGPSIVNRKCF